MATHTLDKSLATRILVLRAGRTSTWAGVRVSLECGAPPNFHTFLCQHAAGCDTYLFPHILATLPLSLFLTATTPLESMVRANNLFCRCCYVSFVCAVFGVILLYHGCMCYMLLLYAFKYCIHISMVSLPVVRPPSRPSAVPTA